MIDKKQHQSTKYPAGTQGLFAHIDKVDHFWYLECEKSHKYLAKTQYSEFMAAYRTTLSGPKPVTFQTYAEAVQHASIQTSRHRKNLKPRVIADFFMQYIAGQFVHTAPEISIYSTIQVPTPIASLKNTGKEA